MMVWETDLWWCEKLTYGWPRNWLMMVRETDLWWSKKPTYDVRETDLWCPRNWTIVVNYPHKKLVTAYSLVAMVQRSFSAPLGFWKEIDLQLSKLKVSSIKQKSIYNDQTSKLSKSVFVGLSWAENKEIMFPKPRVSAKTRQSLPCTEPSRIFARSPRRTGSILFKSPAKYFYWYYFHCRNKKTKGTLKGLVHKWIKFLKKMFWKKLFAIICNKTVVCTSMNWYLYKKE